MYELEPHDTSLYICPELAGSEWQKALQLMRGMQDKSILASVITQLGCSAGDVVGVYPSHPSIPCDQDELRL